jgi:hypothetical protein
VRDELAKEVKAEREYDVSWRKLSKAAKGRRVDNDNAWIQCQIKEHLQEESDFNFIKMHLLTHFTGHVKALGQLSNVSAQLSEALHGELKEPFRRSNKINADSQILQMIARMNCLDYRELNVEAAKRRSDTVNRAKHPLACRLQNARADVQVLTDLASWCEVPRDELQVLITW